MYCIWGRETESNTPPAMLLAVGDLTDDDPALIKVDIIHMASMPN